MSLLPKRGIARLRTCPHGGVNYAEIRALGLKPEDIIDFSVSTNPFMPPPGIKEALSKIPIEEYPDSRSTELREKLAERLGISTEKIMVGSGTTELIRLIAMTYFRRGDRVLILEPTYGEYEPACRIAGARPVKHRVKAEDNFTPEMDDVINLIRQHHPRAVFICNPNNPTGKYLSRMEIERLLDTTDDNLLILDEAYVAFVEESWNSVDLAGRDNIIILRSMTKDYGLPGLRLGYAVACREIIDSLRRVSLPWNVNIIAQHAGVTVLKQEEYLKHSLRQIREGKRFLTDELTQLGLKVLPSDANYFLIKTGNASEFRSLLVKQGILVRDCTSFGLPEYIRISPRTMPECRKLIAAIGSMLESGEYSI